MEMHEAVLWLTTFTAWCACMAVAVNVNQMNVIDRCWRGDPSWARNRMRLANCAVGYGNNAKGGSGGELYVVTSTEDDPVNPAPGTLRYGATRTRPMWITFARDMKIRLKMALMVTSHTTIDGRGARVEIGDGPCIRLYQVTNVIIHGLGIGNCRRGVAGRVLMSESGGVMPVSESDADAIGASGSHDIWFDHNTLFSSDDGLIDITVGSGSATVTNNRLFQHNKTMLLGHKDGYTADKSMKVTVAFNHFGPNLIQRMPRVRSGYAHVVNNNYEPWGIYAIGGSGEPTIYSEGNRFLAPTENRLKQVTYRPGVDQRCFQSAATPCNNPAARWSWKSHGDVFLNGAFFVGSGRAAVMPHYGPGQLFAVAPASEVPLITRDAGALNCRPNSPCL